MSQRLKHLSTKWKKNVKETDTFGMDFTNITNDEDEFYPTSLESTDMLIDPLSNRTWLKVVPKNGTPYGYFKMIFTDSIIELLASNANRGRKRDRKWRILLKSELLTAIGLYLLTGTVKMNFLFEYWSSEEYYSGLVNTCFPLLMSHERFLNIMRALFNRKDVDDLHFVNFVLDMYNERMDDILVETKPKIVMTGLCPAPIKYTYIELQMIIDINGIPRKYSIVDDVLENVKHRYVNVYKSFGKSVAIQWPPETVKVVSEKQEINHDQLMSYYPIDISVKYHQRIGIHLFHVILMSSYYLYNMHESKKLNLHEYRLTLLQSLFRNESSFSVKYQHNLGCHVTTGHYPVLNGAGGTKKVLRCRNCTRNKKSSFTQYHCSGCSASQMVALCINCFKDYH